MTRRWRAIMHGQVLIYEELLNTEARTWRPIGTVIQVGGEAYVPIVNGRTLRVLFNDPEDARWLIENRISCFDRPGVVAEPAESYLAASI